MTDVEIRLATILSAREEQFDAFKRQGDIGQNFMPTELSPCFSDADDSNNITNITNIMEIETNSLENNILDQNSLGSNPLGNARGALNSESDSENILWDSNGLLGDDDPLVEEFKSTGLLDEFAESTSVAHSSYDHKNDHTCDGTESQSKGGLSESQDELPHPSDLLRSLNMETVSSKTITSFESIALARIPASTYNGKTIHFKRKNKRIKSTTLVDKQRTANLLETPIHRLRDQLSVETATKLRQQDSQPSSSSSSTTLDNQLWVDRYRPSRYTELLGDERVHRETMSWLKEWDFCVFGRRKALKKQNKFVNEKEAQNRFEDTYRRPREKILLLSGPPGYGKTTLAHVVARQAGYDIMEINASDARSGQVIDDRVRPALESGSAIGSKRPVCVVIDEIDGATGAGENTSSFIHKLVGLTFERAKKSRGDKNKDTRRPLLRPLICICNDLYASSLTKLRQHARIIRFTRPADTHLAKRLRFICENENLRAESRALSALVGISKGDMRGCLNTLQLIKVRNQEVTEHIVRTATVGMKEGDSSFSTLLTNMFVPISKKRVKELGLCEEEENRYVRRLSMDIESSGSIDKVALGCFEHYPNLRNYDASLDRHEKAADWLTVFDSFSGTMRSEREYGLLPYLPYTIVPFYSLFNERGGTRVERPKADWENLVKTRTSEEIYKSFAGCATSARQQSAGLRHLLSNNILQLEFAPYINRIISPSLRPVNSQVTKPQERVLLGRLADIMVALELRFTQEKTEDGQLVYRLEPPIDTFITYEGKRAADIAIPRYAVRHLVAAEIDARLAARQTAEAVEKGRSKKTLFASSTRTSNDDGREEAPLEKDDEGHLLSSPTRPDHSSLGKRKVEEIDPMDKPPTDFFGRPIMAPSNAKKSKKGDVDPAPKPYKVSYRFNEGNSAAVRKPVKVSFFL